MTAVANAPTIRWSFPTPTPRFPLVGVARSSGVKAALPQLADLAVATITRAWHPIYTGMARSSVVAPRYWAPDARATVVNRQWNGFGTGYVPSFPQLDRHNTTWPHAS